MTVEQYVEQFLLCALEASEGRLSEFLDPQAVMGPAQLDMAEIDGVLSMLIARRYVSSESERADGSVRLIKLTGAGLEHARHLRQISRSKAERAGGSASLQEFAGGEHWWFAGTQVSWDEVLAAVYFLEAENLLAVERTTASIGIRPTPLGIKFALSNMTLRTFMSTQKLPSSGVTNNYGDSIVVHGDVSGSALVTGGGNTQTVNQGVNVDALVSLVAQLRQIAPALELRADDAQDLAEGIDALEREGAEPGRGHKIWRAIMRIVNPALVSAVAAGSEQAVQAAITAGSELFS
ncbi:hypothetical protein AB0L75_28000 [Streptomyces sp. NPDC052101]|uniref:hypothetical protein n=1 Tax=Streptomyces sp. NPDC052101 TaxID=3155763 RepID=UPI00343F9966